MEWSCLVIVDIFIGACKWNMDLLVLSTCFVGGYFCVFLVDGTIGASYHLSVSLLRLIPGALYSSPIVPSIDPESPNCQKKLFRFF
jgi:hypothetical protein